MNLITIIWSMSAAMCFTLAGIHFFVWVYARKNWANLLFSISATAAAVIAIQDLELMHARTPVEFGELFRWMHVSLAIIIIAIVWFIHHYLQTGRLWLAWLICGVRALVLVPNFVMFPNASFREIDSLRHVSFLGQTIPVPVGEQNPWRILIHVSAVLLFIYVLDAAISAWKKGEGHRALVIGGAILMSLILSVTFSALMVRGILPSPFVGLIFLLIVLAMSYELSADLIRAGHLSQELLETQEKADRATRAANLALWEWDIVRDEIWTSDVGRERASVLGLDHIRFNLYLRLVHPDDREAVQEAVRRTFEDDREFHAEYRLTGPGGTTRWIATRGRLERGAHNEPLRMRGVSMDITGRKQVEAELGRQREELAHVQRVSTMGQLSTTLAHELNQPLGAILRNAEAGELLLRRSPADLKELRDVFVDIQQDERRAASVIDRMRSLLRRSELRFDELALDELIQQIAILLRAEIQARYAVLRVEVAQDLPKIRGDRIQLQQVVLNLLLNSLDALETKQNEHPQIAIRASRVEEKMVELVIRDNGAGANPDQLPHLFEPFFTTKTKGTGIGLAISKTIIQTHGGQIWAENNPDGGMTVRLTLPVAHPGGVA